MRLLTSPTYTIVIPCYNEALYISDTLESLSKQDFAGKLEVIVVDNNCTDETVGVARRYGAKVVAEEKVGVCWARQAGTAAATGDIVISTDADTVFSSNWLTTIDQTFRSNPTVVAVCGPCVFMDAPWFGDYTRGLFSFVNLYTRIFGRPCYITATNTAFKRAAWDAYNTSLTQGGDELDLLYNLRRRGRIIFNKRNPVYTSSRRLDKGAFYNFFVSFFFYYLCAYYLNRIFRRTILGSAPAIREETGYRNKVRALIRSVTSNRI